MIQAYCDNKTAVSTVNKMGAVQSRKRQSIMLEICAITTQMKVKLKRFSSEGVPEPGSR